MWGYVIENIKKENIMIKKLKKYNIVEDVEPILNSLQQLKAEILSLRKDGVYADDMYWVGWNMALECAAGMLKLSAV